MKPFTEIPTNLILSETAPKAVSSADASARTGEGHTATTEQAVPLAPQATSVLEPISGGQSFILVMFGVVAFIMMVAMTRFGSKNNYGD